MLTVTSVGTCDTLNSVVTMLAFAWAAKAIRIDKVKRYSILGCSESEATTTCALTWTSWQAQALVCVCVDALLS